MNQFQQIQQNMQMGSGLTRYRSAPSSYFATFLNNTDGGFGAEEFGQLFNPGASSPETQRIFARFMNGPETIQQSCSQNMTLQSQSQFLPPRTKEIKTEQPQPQELQRQRSNDYSSSVMYQSSGAVNSAVRSSYDEILGANRGPEMKMHGGGGGGGGGGLVRHSSSPVGLFDNINIESGIMPPISQVEDKSIRENNPGYKELGEEHDYLINDWDDSTILSDEFLKGLSETDSKLFPKEEAPEDQNNEGGNRSTTPLSHHLSLPKSPAMEKLLRDTVPCRIRAKRGCATHPRSIAERVRRTKISERMRKLQELVPNMEKQTNTADMLDLAVDYIKDLQRRVKMLSDNHSKCSCSAKKRA